LPKLPKSDRLTMHVAILLHHALKFRLPGTYRQKRRIARNVPLVFLDNWDRMETKWCARGFLTHRSQRIVVVTNETKIILQ